MEIFKRPKIARIDPKSTIFGPIELQLHDLFPKNSNERSEQNKIEKFFVVAAAVVVVGRFRGDTHRILNVNNVRCRVCELGSWVAVLL